MDYPSSLVRLKLYDRIAAGLLGGAIAGFFMMATLCAGYLLAGHPIQMPIRLVAATFLGDTALLPSNGGGILLAGLVAHLLVSAFFGGVFAVITRSRSHVALAFQGVLFGLAIGWYMGFILLPTGVNLALAARMPSGIYLAGHVVYGLALPAALLPLEKKLLRRDLKAHALGQNV